MKIDNKFVGYSDDDSNLSQIERVARMEQLHDKSRDAVYSLLEAAEKYNAARAGLRELTEYYESPLWMKDFFDEREDVFPKDMKRGILAEDTVYDLLTDEMRLMQILEDMVGSYKAELKSKTNGNK